VGKGLQRLLELAREQGCRLVEVAALAKDFEHAPARGIEAVVLPRLQVEENCLGRECPGSDVFWNREASPGQMGIRRCRASLHGTGAPPTGEWTRVERGKSPLPFGGGEWLRRPPRSSASRGAHAPGGDLREGVVFAVEVPGGSVAAGRKVLDAA